MFIFCADFRTVGSRPASTQTAVRSLAKSTKHEENTQKEHNLDPFADCGRGYAFVRGKAVYSKKEVSTDDLYSVSILESAKPRNRKKT
jgi:hypothetical protein